MASRAWGINADGGSPAYSAEDGRRALGMSLYPGVSDNFGSRPGVRPGHDPVVSVSGTTWTVHDLLAVVTTAASGSYVVSLEEESDSLDPADGSNDRIDALDLEVQDDDEDASGERRARVVYTAGTPAGSPSAPSLDAGRVRLATIDVPAGGSPSPSVIDLADWTVAAGGILPVRDTSELPTAGRHEGMAAWDLDARALLIRDDAAWTEMAGPLSIRRVGRSSTQSIPNNSDTLIEWQTPSSAFTAGISPFTLSSSTQAVIARDGVHRVTASLSWAGNSSSWRRVSVQHHPGGGSADIIAQQSSSFDTSGITQTINVSTVFPAEAGDEFSITGRHNISGGGSLNINADARTFLVVERLGSL